MTIKKTTKTPAKKLTKPVLAYTVKGDDALGNLRFESVMHILTDSAIVDGDYDGDTIEVWKKIGEYKIVAGKRTLEEVK